MSVLCILLHKEIYDDHDDDDFNVLHLNICLDGRLHRSRLLPTLKYCKDGILVFPINHAQAKPQPAAIQNVTIQFNIGKQLCA
jgi:hypothetical protein